MAIKPVAKDAFQTKMTGLIEKINKAKHQVREELFATLRRYGGIELVVFANGQGDDGAIDDWHLMITPHSSTGVYDGTYSTRYPILSHDAMCRLEREEFIPGCTVKQAIEDYALELIDDNSDGIDWVNGNGGSVQLSLDLTRDKPIVSVLYRYRVVSLENAGTYHYDALTGKLLSTDISGSVPLDYLTDHDDPHIRHVAEAADQADFAELQSIDWEEIEGCYSTDSEENEE